MGAGGGYWHNSFSRSLMMALRASGDMVRGHAAGPLRGVTPLPRPNDHAPLQRGPQWRSPALREGLMQKNILKWVAPRRGGDEATDLIIKHHASASLGASLFILYLSRYLISLIKKASKNKLQQLKNTALKALALHGQARDPRGDHEAVASNKKRARTPLRGAPPAPLAPAPSEGGPTIACPTAKRWHRPKSKILGIGFAFSGRVYGAQKAATFKMLLGSVPFNTLDARIDYANIMQQTRNGT